MLSKIAYYILGFSFLISGFFLIDASLGGITGFSVLNMVEIDMGTAVGIGFFIFGIILLIVFRKLELYLIKKGIES
jgi:hypothetical protein